MVHSRCGSSRLFATMYVQDFHDVEGDCAAGRRNLPIILTALQLTHLRRFTAIVIVAAVASLEAPGIKLCEESYYFSLGLLASLQFLGGYATATHFLLAEKAVQGETRFKLFHIPTTLAIIAYLSLLSRHHAVSSEKPENQGR